MHEVRPLGFMNCPASGWSGVKPDADELFVIASFYSCNIHSTISTIDGINPNMLSRLLLLTLLLPLPVVADEAQPSVEDNIRAMDTDHDGMVTAHEMRVFLEKKHGKDYQQDLMNELEAKAGEKSCASPFTKSFY